MRSCQTSSLPECPIVSMLIKSYRTNKRERHTYGTIDQLIINKMVMDNVKLKHSIKNLNLSQPLSEKQWITGKRHYISITEMVKLKPMIFQPILVSFREIAHQGYSSFYSYFHSLGYWTQATSNIELITKVTLFHICCSWTILNSLLQTMIKICINDKNRQ